MVMIDNIIPILLFMFIIGCTLILIDILYPKTKDQKVIKEYSQRQFVNEITNIYKRKPTHDELYKICKVAELYKKQYGYFPPPTDLERIIIKHKSM